jgi:hypothetical protein
MLEDNLIVWRNFPLGVIATFPDFVGYLRRVKDKDISMLKEKQETKANQ